MRKHAQAKDGNGDADGLEGTAEATTARLVGFSKSGHLLVEVATRQGGKRKLAARSLLRNDQALRRAVLEKREVLVVFEGGDRSRPVVTGVLQPPADGPSPGEVARLHTLDPKPVAIEVDVDGRRMCVSAEDEIVLRCGKASITLRRNGRIVIQGVSVETSSEGTNRIRGGQIRLN